MGYFIQTIHIYQYLESLIIWLVLWWQQLLMMLFINLANHTKTDRTAYRWWQSTHMAHFHSMPLLRDASMMTLGNPFQKRLEFFTKCPKELSLLEHSFMPQWLSLLSLRICSEYQIINNLSVIQRSRYRCYIGVKHMREIISLSCQNG